jgi:hypothetical protein
MFIGMFSPGARVAKARRNDTGLDDSNPSLLVFHEGRKESQEKYAGSQGSAIIVGYPIINGQQGLRLSAVHRRKTFAH